jgi:hypothetical protein
MDKKEQIKKLLTKITELIEEVLDEKDTVEEISTGVGLGGAPGGPLGSLGMPRKRSTRRRIVRPDPPKQKR